jgi:two-component system, OmpR family, sensor histidine kinase ArlS
MPIRLRITLLFTLLVFAIMGLVAISVYYFSYTSRINTVKTRLTNRAITVGRLLSRSDVFTNDLIQRLDSATSVAFINNVMQAYDFRNTKIYGYSSLPGDSLHITPELLHNVRVNGDAYFTVGAKDVIAHQYSDERFKAVIVAGGEDEDGKKGLSRLLRILVISFSGGISIAFLGGYFFSRGLLKPIRKIADEVNAISAQHFSKRIQSGDTQDEWNYLANTLNSLLDRLQESFDLQKRFIANASHEISTPLTSISSQIEVCLQRERAAEEYKMVLNSVHQDVLHMTKLTQTLLELAKASGSRGGLEIKPVRIDEVLYRLPAEIAKIDKGYSVLFDLDELPQDPEKLLVFGNEELLFTAIKNVVVNACKYSGDHAARIKLKIDPEFVILCVQDNGIGISKEHYANIFEPFYRVNDDRAKDGFGLGLSLASRIVKLHKGEIQIDSEPGVGTLFTIRMPAAGSHSKAAQRTVIV